MDPIFIQFSHCRIDLDQLSEWKLQGGIVAENKEDLVQWITAIEFIRQT